MAANWRDGEFATPRVRAEIQGANPVAYMILFAVVLFVIAAVVWAKYTVIDEVTRGEGKVIPSSQIQVVQNLEGGIVKELRIGEGDLVEKDQVLLVLDDTSFSSDLGEIQSNALSLKAKIARLQAEVEDRELSFPPEVTAEAASTAQDERELMQARRQSLESQVSILEGQAAQRRQELAELRGKIEQARSSLSLLQEEISITRPLVQNGVVPKINLLRLEREANDLEGEIQASRLAIPRAEAALREATERIEEKYLAFRSEAQTELNQARAELAAIEERLRGASDRVRRTDIRSPVNGVVKTLHVRTIGGVIRPGMDIVEVVPLDDTLLVEAKIRPADIGFLRPGQTATVKFTAYDFSIYGGLEGTVERISADTITEEETQESFYQVVVRTKNNSLERNGKVLPLMPGMVASVDILTGKRSILDYILKPILKAKSNALTER
ncbi:HlyD family type I secretion periplasmic adaptor subunit [Roseospirillum parvum]|uniref:Membrane fusion protein (MFP) family protein n=1 Tax=Roseospirillum parvum TaxID=83401 RepID=A0A1G7TJH9_9PROT|nr:HlyD family type I secretion periplasmic adaptor subunit [Roseospirillum parvum]SDG35493.1 membrane fusion protein, adhesin transport system [Roseospirillum parvum]